MDLWRLLDRPIDTQNKEISNNHKLIKSVAVSHQLISVDDSTNRLWWRREQRRVPKLKLEYPVVHFSTNTRTTRAVSTRPPSLPSNATKQHNDCPLCVDRVQGNRDTASTNLPQR